MSGHYSFGSEKNNEIIVLHSSVGNVAKPRVDKSKIFLVRVVFQKSFTPQHVFNARNSF